MNDNSANDATNQPVTLDNKATPDAAIFVPAIARFLSSDIKLGIEIFSKGNIKKISDKDTIDTTPSYDVPNNDNNNATTQDYGSNDSNSPYSLRNRIFAPYSTTTIKNQKKNKNKIDDKDKFDTPLSPTHLKLVVE